MSIAASVPRSGSWKICSSKSHKRIMRQIRNIAFSLITASLFVCSGFVIATLGQATPTPAPTLPPGMVGARKDDPRAKLSPGLYDAGEAALGIKHLQLL